MITKTPLTLITGYLGSGKTTLLRNIVRDARKKIAIVVNEFGEIPIDSKVLEGKNIRMAELAGGCVCCSLSGEFEAAVEEIINEIGPDIIFVETTGLAEPDSLIDIIGEALKMVKLDTVVTVVDADAMVRFPEIGYTGRIQIESADVILINKIDLVHEEDLLQVEERVKEINRRATLFRTSFCNIDTELLSGMGIERYLSHAVHAQHDMDYFTFCTNEIIKRERFEEMVKGLSGKIYRAKGFVKFSDGSYLFNYVSDRWDFEEFESEGTRLVFIGHRAGQIKDEVISQLESMKLKFEYRFLEDLATADVAFEAKGDTIEELFISSALATTNIMILQTGQIDLKDRREIEIEAEELDLLLFNLLQEMIFFKDTEKLIFGEFNVKIGKKGDKWMLRMKAAGERINPEKHMLHLDVKAVTLHMLEVRKDNNGWIAHVILDV